jgi:cell filamentation protein
MTNPYVYPGTEVLINKEDIRDHGDLEAFERIMTAARMETLPTKIPVTEDGYRRLHRYIFQDVYEWAGEYRTVNIAKGGHMFCLVPYIADQMRQRFAAIQAKSGPGLSVREEFVGRAAEHISELNAIHPFREGNGRALRAFLECLANEVGLRIALQRIDPVAWIDASICGFRDGHYEPMRRVIDTAVVAADWEA